MASETTHYGLVKPAENDYYDIEIYNENMDKVDAALKANAEEAAEAAAGQSRVKEFMLTADGWTTSGSGWKQSGNMTGLSDDYVLSWSWETSADGLACVEAEMMLEASCDSTGLATLTWTAKALPTAAISVFVVAELPVAAE